MIQSCIQCDVLVIGGGGAGIRAAIEAHDYGAEVLIASKKKLGFCGSTFYLNSLPWGILTAGYDEKSEEVFFNEIIDASHGCLNKKLAEILVRDSNERFSDLCNYGMKFTLLENMKLKPCFGRNIRGAVANSIDNIRQCFLDQLSKRNIKTIEDFYVFDLIVKENACYGAIGIDERGETVIIYSKAVVIATGGAEYLWKYNFATPDLIGDGYAMAAKHGARLTNLEFIQFIPGTINPVGKINFYHPTLETLPLVLNRYGEEFLNKYLPEGVTVEECLIQRSSHGPFSNEDNSRYFEFAIVAEEERDENTTIRGAEIKYTDAYYADSRYKRWRDFLTSRGIDTKKMPLTIYPHCQGFNGGVVIDEHCSTDIENLYACGESAGGPHGANRMGGNAILGTQVFGKIAGEEAAKKAKSERRWNTLNKDYAYIFKDSYDTGNISKYTPEETINNIRYIMHKSANIMREEKGLKEAINSIKEMRLQYNAYELIKGGNDIKEVISAYNALITANVILHSMLYRKESRGGHFRKDYPNKNGKYGRMNYIKMNKQFNILVEPVLNI